MQDVLNTSERTVIDLPLEVKAGGLPGEFEGYGAVFGNTDRDGDVVAKGAFADSLKARLPALLWQHNAREPIGRFDVVREDERGLFVKGRLAQSGRGAEAYELLKMGALNGLSIGFVTKEAMRNSAAGTRTIKRADLMEVSLVTFPANELARVQTVKQRTESMDANFETGDINDPRTFERFLREQGFSRNRAKAITAKGFKGSSKDEMDFSALIAELQHKQNRIIKNTALQLESKVSKRFNIWAPPLMIWSAWTNMRQTVASDGTGTFSVSLDQIGEAVGRIQVEIDYVSPRGRQTGKFIAPGSKKFVAAEGWQEPKIRVKSLSGTGQTLRGVLST